MRNLLSTQTRSIARRTRSTRMRLASLERLEGRELLTGFSFSDFATTAGLNLVGSASATVDNRLRLTPSVSSTGGAWYVAEKPIVAGNFETTFQFKLSTATGGADGSDGFAFVIQNSSPTELRDGGGGLGYNGMPNSLAIEFDTWLNNGSGDPYNDPSQSHIGVHTNGTGANGTNESFRVGSSYNTSGFLLDDAQVHTARLGYTSGTLTVYLDNLTTPVLTVPIDLGTTLGLDHGRAWVGFTAAAGGSPLNQDILNWSFSGTDDVILANPASVIEGAAPGTSALQFTLDRLGSTVGSVAVNWATANGTATAGTDYVAASGQVMFLDGESQKTVSVSINGDASVESHETLRLVLSSSAGATVASGLGTILNDDAAISVGDVQVTEGDLRLGAVGALVTMAGNGGLDRSTGMTYGPDGNLYVGSLNSNEVLRYDADTGVFLGAFVTAASGGLNGPAVDGLSFRPDGKLYVASRNSSSVLRYDASTGTYLDTFIPGGSGGLLQPKGMVFAPDGSVLISSGTNEVLRYSGATGAFLGAFVTAGSGGLSNPRSLTFGPDGNLYVSSSASHAVLKYNGTTGAFLSTFITANSGGLNNPGGLLFSNGRLYVASQNTNQVLRYDAATGAFIDDAVPASSDGLHRPIGLMLDAAQNLLVGGNAELLRYAAPYTATFKIRLNHAVATPVTVDYATMSGTAQAVADFIAVAGTVTFAPGETVKTIRVEIANDAVGEPTETFTITLSNPVGGSIAEGVGVGVGTIIDNDPGPTKFYVVNDSTGDRTYEYTATGNGVENYALNTGNTAPRGAASTVAGNKVWVVDANKKVYVYGADGLPLGSWTAGSLSGKAVVEGIATDGTDVWIVDAGADRVFRYANAAGRIDGTQTATSSFSLFIKGNGKFSPDYSNLNAKDIVTDGTSLWVINDGVSEDKVFKYSLDGVAAWTNGWTIDPANSKPTGITLDPGNPDHLWIVDAGTKRVYQYNNGVARVGGGLAWSASSSFALAAGNTNPQGIADPPAPGTTTVAAPRRGGSPGRPASAGHRSPQAVGLVAPTEDQLRVWSASKSVPSGPRSLRPRLAGSHRRP